MAVQFCLVPRYSSLQFSWPVSLLSLLFFCHFLIPLCSFIVPFYICTAVGASTVFSSKKDSSTCSKKKLFWVCNILVLTCAVLGREIASLICCLIFFPLNNNADGTCIQTIEHPGCIWDVKFLENGDIVTACSDGTARIWTTDTSRFCADEEVAAYTDLISQYALSRLVIFYYSFIRQYSPFCIASCGFHL
jgi:WD40 repeat protein